MGIPAMAMHTKPVTTVNLPALTPEMIERDRLRRQHATEAVRARNAAKVVKDIMREQESLSRRANNVRRQLKSDERKQLRSMPIDQIRTWMDNHRFALMNGVAVGRDNYWKAKMFRLELIRREWTS